ncbi:hypothetical protein [Nocardiopsis algeriensis]|uniref:Uncharacterized protein n=1 Tax=Nocardiopsis algeriensis TaxID=1478215 RepID=A0A841IR95_9ACTN|nr:hypothetical protein [Nocardiopsis algeriensis]MBB6119145.1 hypothetical protein [Nocardiopsis algeriensis]
MENSLFDFRAALSGEVPTESAASEDSPAPEAGSPVVLKAGRPGGAPIGIDLTTGLLLLRSDSGTVRVDTGTQEAVLDPDGGEVVVDDSGMAVLRAQARGNGSPDLPDGEEVRHTVLAEAPEEADFSGQEGSRDTGAHTEPLTETRVLTEAEASPVPAEPAVLLKRDPVLPESAVPATEPVFSGKLISAPEPGSPVEDAGSGEEGTQEDTGPVVTVDPATGAITVEAGDLELTVDPETGTLGVEPGERSLPLDPEAGPVVVEAGGMRLTVDPGKNTIGIEAVETDEGTEALTIEVGDLRLTVDPETDEITVDPGDGEVSVDPGTGLVTISEPKGQQDGGSQEQGSRTGPEEHVRSVPKDDGSGVEAGAGQAPFAPATGTPAGGVGPDGGAGQSTSQDPATSENLATSEDPADGNPPVDSGPASDPPTDLGQDLGALATAPQQQEPLMQSLRDEIPGDPPHTSSVRPSPTTSTIPPTGETSSDDSPEDSGEDKGEGTEPGDDSTQDLDALATTQRQRGPLMQGISDEIPGGSPHIPVSTFSPTTGTTTPTGETSSDDSPEDDGDDSPEDSGDDKGGEDGGNGTDDGSGDGKNEGTAIDLDRLKAFQRDFLLPLRERASEETARFSRYQSDSSGSGEGGPHILLGNEKFLPIAGELAKEIDTSMSKLHAILTALEDELIRVEDRLSSNMTAFVELEDAQHLSAQEVVDLIGSPSVGRGGAGAGAFTTTDTDTSDTA